MNTNDPNARRSIAPGCKATFEPERKSLSADFGFLRGIRTGHRQDFGPFSDIDLVLIVASSGERFLDRAEGFRPSAFPVPTDLLVYTLEEVEQMRGSGHPFWKHIEAHHTSLFEAV